MKTGGGVSVWVKEAISERVHVVHVVGSVVDLLQEVLQLLDEDAFLEPLDTEAQQTSAVRGFYLPPVPRLFQPRALPGGLLDDVLEEDEPRVQSSLDLLQEEEDLLVV